MYNISSAGRSLTQFVIRDQAQSLIIMVDTINATSTISRFANVTSTRTMMITIIIIKSNNNNNSWIALSARKRGIIQVWPSGTASPQEDITIIIRGIFFRNRSRIMDFRIMTLTRDNNMLCTYPHATINYLIIDILFLRFKLCHFIRVHIPLFSSMLECVTELHYTIYDAHISTWCRQVYTLYGIKKRRGQIVCFDITRFLSYTPWCAHRGV